MEKIVVALLMISGVYCYPCGDPPVCSCKENLGLVVCKGIEKFPKFNRSEVWNIDMLDIVNTSLHKLPKLDDWTNLAMLSARGNPYLECSELLYEGYSFYVNSDCPIMSKPLVEVKEEINWPYFLSIIPLIIVGLAGGYQAIREHLRNLKVAKVKEKRAGRVDINEEEFLEEAQSSEIWRGGRI